MGLASSYIKFYLKWGFAIVLWNYRGYGKSTGIASVCKSMSDIRKVYEHVTKKLKMTVQVLHGYSIGGVCAINLAKELNQGTTKPIKLLIADRTFASIDRMAKGLIKEQNSVAKVIKRISKPVVRTLFKSDCIDNSVRFVECQCPKICIWDTIDTIVDKRASLRHMIISHAKNW
jgi:esterase/lipase